MISLMTRTVMATALSFGMIGAAHSQESVRADPEKVKQVQQILERNPEARRSVFSALEARDGSKLERSLSEAGILRLFDEPAALAGVLCFVDGIPMPSHVCNRFLSHNMHDWAAY